MKRISILRATSIFSFAAGIVSMTASLMVACGLLVFAGITDMICDRLEARERGGR